MVRISSYERREPVAFHTLMGGKRVFGASLLAKRYRERNKAKGDLYGIDAVLGDDKYVFLSVGTPYCAVRGKEKLMCYSFDAEELIKQGAKLRKKDILGTAAFRRFELVYSRELSKWEEDYNDAMYSRGSPYERSKEKTLTGRYYTRFHTRYLPNTESATKEQLLWIFDHSPEIKHAFEKLKQEADQMTLEGEDAIREIYKCMSKTDMYGRVIPDCELLVEKELPLAAALSSGTLKRMMKGLYR